LIILPEDLRGVSIPVMQIEPDKYPIEFSKDGS
jgi:hypothetical protein